MSAVLNKVQGLIEVQGDEERCKVYKAGIILKFKGLVLQELAARQLSLFQEYL